MQPENNSASRKDDGALSLQPPGNSAVTDGEDSSNPNHEVGSGLIDMRSLADTLEPEPEPILSEGEVNDLISFGEKNAMPSYCAPLAETDAERFKKRIKLALIGGLALTVAALVAFFVTYANREDDAARLAQQGKLAMLEQRIAMLKRDLTEQLPTPQAAPTQAVDESALKAPSGQLAALRPQPDKPPVPVKRSRTAPPPKAKTTKPSNSAAPRTAVASLLPKKAPPKQAPPKKAVLPKSEPTHKRKSTDKSELDELLGPSTTPPPKKKSKNREVAKDTSPRQPKGQSNPNSPPTALNRSQVQKGMQSAAGAVRRCGEGKGGSVSLTVVISKSGRVIAANAVGTHAGTPVGLCAARAVRKARFPKFNGPSMTIKFPFKLK